MSLEINYVMYDTSTISYVYECPLLISFLFFAALIATFGDINAAVERLLALNQLSLS